MAVCPRNSEKHLLSLNSVNSKCINSPCFHHQIPDKILSRDMKHGQMEHKPKGELTDKLITIQITITTILIAYKYWAVRSELLFEKTAFAHIDGWKNQSNYWLESSKSLKHMHLWIPSFVHIHVGVTFG